MKTKYTFIAIFVAILTLLSGCASSSTKYVKTGGTEALVTDSINLGDIISAAETLTNRMLSEVDFDATGEPQPIKMKVGRIANRTSKRFDIDMLIAPINSVLTRTGKIKVMSEDAISSELAEYQAAKAGKTVSAPKIVLTGKIAEMREYANNTREANYVFFLNLNYKGSELWSGQVPITKQTTQSSFGF